jgi:hypothetical protein
MRRGKIPGCTLILFLILAVLCLTTAYASTQTNSIVPDENLSNEKVAVYIVYVMDPNLAPKEIIDYRKLAKEISWKRFRMDLFSCRGRPDPKEIKEIPDRKANRD